MPERADTDAIFGGTGFLGRRVLKHLLRDGHRVRIVARRPQNCGDLASHARAEPGQAGLVRPETFGPAQDGVRGVLNATSLYRETHDLTFEDFHCKAASQLAASARMPLTPSLPSRLIAGSRRGTSRTPRHGWSGKVDTDRGATDRANEPPRGTAR